MNQPQYIHIPTKALVTQVLVYTHREGYVSTERLASRYGGGVHRLL